MTCKKETLILIENGVHLKKTDTKKPRFPTASEIAEQKEIAEKEGIQRLPEDLPHDKMNRTFHELIKEEKVELKKVNQKIPRIPTAAEIAEQKELAEKEGIQRLPEDLPHDKMNRTFHELIKEEKVELKKVDQKKPILPSAKVLAEQKEIAEKEGIQRLPEDLPRDKMNRTFHELIKEEKVELKKVDQKKPTLPSAEIIAEQKEIAEKEGTQRLPEDLPRDSKNRTFHELIKEEKVELKKVETKKPRLPTAQEIAEQRKLQQSQ
ncbi:hypothetical protein GPJ56_002900 [Histomonas meleagridis]|uniref:uncharacterized protein n=1 Tax=Histomonas meleagridis TaxID=135588 RepID=UPI0035597369|nr:hypothetical protein GPJ56_002900 [Histomonas meleagridis]KAH0800399.1 hypothetical protein GO595_006810 [Histomonas meleagridis]